MAGFGARVSLSFPLRLPNTLVLLAGGFLGPQLLDQGRQERTLGLLGLAAACQPLRYLQEHLGGAMIGGDFRNHLAVIGGRAEHLWVPPGGGGWGGAPWPLGMLWRGSF